jgi:hypothetical protein
MQASLHLLEVLPVKYYVSSFIILPWIGADSMMGKNCLNMYFNHGKFVAVVNMVNRQEVTASG